jgi:glutamate dehydrogenase (NAD(P)+)
VLADEGICVEDLAEFMRHSGGVKDFPGAKYMSDGRAALEGACDILVPAALEGQITSENAPRIQANLIAEAANGPVSFNADQLLTQRGKVVIPDVYLNAGGVTVSYFEWVKNVSHIRFGRLDRRFEEARGHRIVRMVENVVGTAVPDELRQPLFQGAEELDLVRSGLDDTMRNAYREMREVKQKTPNVPDLRTAAFVVAIRKIATAYQESGIGIG